MSGFRNSGLQVAEYVWDQSVDGGGTGSFDLSGKAGFNTIPDGAVILDVNFLVDTEVDSSGDSVTIDIGNGNDADGYFSSVSESNLGANSVHRAGEVAGALIWDNTNDHYLGVHVSDDSSRKVELTVNSESATQGRIRVFVTYYYPGNE